MSDCKNLFFLSTVACQLSSCLSTEELAILSADLVVLGDMLANIIAREAITKETTLVKRIDVSQKIDYVLSDKVLNKDMSAKKAFQKGEIIDKA